MRIPPGSHYSTQPAQDSPREHRPPPTAHRPPPTAHRPADLVVALTQRFAVDEDIARRDVARFLAELDAAGLLEHPA